MACITTVCIRYQKSLHQDRRARELTEGIVGPRLLRVKALRHKKQENRRHRWQHIQRNLDSSQSPRTWIRAMSVTLQEYVAKRSDNPPKKKKDQLHTANAFKFQPGNKPKPLFSSSQG